LTATNLEKNSILVKTITSLRQPLQKNCRFVKRIRLALKGTQTKLSHLRKQELNYQLSINKKIGHEKLFFGIAIASFSIPDTIP